MRRELIGLVGLTLGEIDECLVTIDLAEESDIFVGVDTDSTEFSWDPDAFIEVNDASAVSEGRWLEGTAGTVNGHILSSIERQPTTKLENRGLE